MARCNILLIPVNFNSYSELKDYIHSVNISDGIGTDFSISIIIADNSTIREDIDFSKYANIDISIRRLPNLGYFGGAFQIYNSVDLSVFNYVVISNVDLTFDKDFFLRLSRLKSDNIGWLSPFRFSKTYNQPLSAGLKTTRPSKLKINLLRLYFKFPDLVRLRWNPLKKIPRENVSEWINLDHELYCGTGSCFILTKNFTACNPQVEYPVFLYGEELFIAELCRKNNLRVVYASKLRINDIGQVSTGKVDFKKICAYNSSGLKFIYNKFYK